MRRAFLAAFLLLAACPPGTGMPGSPDAPSQPIDASAPADAPDILGPPWELVWQDEFDGPAIDRLKNSAIERIVRKVCSDFGVRHRSHPTLVGALASHLRHMKKMGRGAEPTAA